MPEEGRLLPHKRFPGPPFFEDISNQFGFFGDSPAIIAQVQIKHHRMPEDICLIPARRPASCANFVLMPRMASHINGSSAGVVQW